MAETTWRGDSLGQSECWSVTPLGMEKGDIFKITINGKTLEVESESDVLSDLTAQITTAWNSSTEPEFAKITATDRETDVLLCGDDLGRHFTVTSTTSNKPKTAVTVVETTPGAEGTNETQKITLFSPTGGTFTVSWDAGSGAETTSAIAYNATATVLHAALNALATPVPGDFAVEGPAGGPYYITFQGAFAGTDVNLMSVNGSSLTGPTVTVTTVQPGGGSSSEIQAFKVRATAGTFTLTFRGQTTAAINYNDAASVWKTRLEALDSIDTVTVAGSIPQSALITPIGENYKEAGIQQTFAAPGLYLVVFGGTLGSTAADPITVTDNKLTLWNDSGSVELVTRVGGGQSTSDEFVFLDIGYSDADVAAMTADDFIGVTYGAAPGQFISRHTVKRNASDVILGTGRTGNRIVAEIVDQNDNIDAGEFVCIASAGGDRVRSNALTPFVAEAEWFTSGLFRFTGALANTNVLPMFITGWSRGTPPQFSGGGNTLVVGGSTSNEVQHVYTAATGGTFTLTDGVSTTSSIAYNAAASTMKTRIEADIAAITTVTVTGTGTPDDPWVVTVTNPAQTDLAEFVGAAGSLTGGAGSVVVITDAAAGATEVQTITLESSVTDGSYTLSFRGETTSAVQFDDTASTIQTLLRGLATIGGTAVGVAGSAGGPYTVTFASPLNLQDVPLIEADARLLTVGAGTETLTSLLETEGGGPNNWDTALNWTGGRVPDYGDTVAIGPSDSDILYGLNQKADFTVNTSTNVVTFTTQADFVTDQIVRVFNTGGGLPTGLAAATNYYILDFDRPTQTCRLSASSGGSAINITGTGTGTQTAHVTLTEMRVFLSYGGQIGLPQVDENDIWESLQTYLTVGATLVNVGKGRGPGSGLFKLDTFSEQTTINVYDTGGVTTPGEHAFQWVGTHASNTITQLEGDVGVSVLPFETATLIAVVQRGGALELGKGTTVSLSIDSTGGTLDANDVSGNFTYLRQG